MNEHFRKRHRITPAFVIFVVVIMAISPFVGAIQLSSEDMEEREQARQKLLRLGKIGIPLIEKQLAEARKVAEQIHSLQFIINKLKR